MILISRSALDALQAAVSGADKTDQGVRIAVGGCGCSAPSYSMTLEDRAGEDDTVIEIRGLRIYVANHCLPKLAGISVDYVEGSHGLGFEFTPPETPMEPSPEAAAAIGKCSSCTC